MVQVFVLLNTRDRVVLGNVTTQGWRTAFELFELCEWGRFRVRDSGVSPFFEVVIDDVDDIALVQTLGLGILAPTPIRGVPAAARDQKVLEAPHHASRDAVEQAE